jgi:hypothetical protein
MINDLLVTSAFHECRLDTSHSNRSCSYLLYFLLQTPPGTPTEAEMNAGDYPGDGSNLDYGREISNKVMSGELTFSSHQVPKKSAHVKVRTARPQIVRYPSSHAANIYFAFVFVPPLFQNGFSNIVPIITSPFRNSGKEGPSLLEPSPSRKPGPKSFRLGS